MSLVLLKVPLVLMMSLLVMSLVMFFFGIVV